MKSDRPIISYDNIHLSAKVSDILEEDLWVSDSFSLGMFTSIIDPVKFSATAVILVKKGSCRADLNLIEYEIKAPCLVIIRSGQIMTPRSASSDFDASFIVLSNKLTATLFACINKSPAYTIINRTPVVPVDPNHLIHYAALHNALRSILMEKDNPTGYECVVHTLLAFFYRFGCSPYLKMADDMPKSNGRIADRFVKLVQEHFRQERFLDFYANELGISAKHLSRSVKAQTGISAVNWIERHVVLEAQVMLKSSKLNIQQISDELNFKSQSFFGKYFKKFTGVSPKDYRNGHR